MKSQHNIVLIGMPGVGKSTLGVLLAKVLGRPFLDTDILIQSRTGCLLQEYIQRHGRPRFRQIEEQVVCSLTCEATVIATGGSVVYSRRAMEHLARGGIIVWLNLSLPALDRRLEDLDARGVLRQPGQSLRDLFEERRPLYHRYADIVIACDGLDHDMAVQVIVSELQAHIKRSSESESPAG